ncbi:MAG: hypothetical protein AABX16_00335 [Nanoarchaeota archaeon]
MENEEKKDDIIEHSSQHTPDTETKPVIKKSMRKNLILLLITVFIMLFIFEIFLIFFYPQKLYNDCYEYSGNDLSNLDVDLDHLLGWSSKKNFTGCAYQPDSNKIFYKTHNSGGFVHCRKYLMKKVLRKEFLY